jgi:hypothetical protein
VSDWVDTEDPWSSQAIRLDPSWLGSQYDFWHYLDGESQVPVSKPEDVWEWLVGCEKNSDMELFQQRDYWQHPLTFERLRRGDCEDHALWAWRKLGELGISARFYVGRFQWKLESAAPPSFHAWVTFEDESGVTLIESMAAAVEDMARPLEKVCGDYSPHLSVGHYRDTRLYGGFLEYRAWERKNRSRLPSWNRRRPLLGD